MNSTIRLASRCAAVAMMAWSAAASASPTKLPSPPNCDAPTFVRVGGAQTSAGVPDPSIAFTVAIRDFANNPVAGSSVVIDFSGCSDLRLCSAQVSNQYVDCAYRMVVGTTDITGKVTMSILGAANDPGTAEPPAMAPGAGLGAVRIFADGVQIQAATAAIYDLNGAVGTGNGGVNGADLGVLKSDVGAALLSGGYCGRSDYNGDRVINGADIGVFRDILGRSNLGQGSAAGCASGGTSLSYCP
jgi:hypothetical protein